MGDTVVLDSGYTPRQNGLLAPVVREFVSLQRSVDEDGPYWTAPVACFAVLVDGREIATADFCTASPLSRRGLIARLRAEKSEAPIAAVVGRRSGLRTSSAGPTLSERDA